MQALVLARIHGNPTWQSRWGIQGAPSRPKTASRPRPASISPGWDGTASPLHRDAIVGTSGLKLRDRRADSGAMNNQESATWDNP